MSQIEVNERKNQSCDLAMITEERSLRTWNGFSKEIRVKQENRRRNKAFQNNSTEERNTVKQSLSRPLSPRQRISPALLYFPSQMKITRRASRGSRPLIRWTLSTETFSARRDNKLHYGTLREKQLEHHTCLHTELYLTNHRTHRETTTNRKKFLTISRNCRVKKVACQYSQSQVQTPQSSSSLRTDHWPLQHRSI